MNITASLDFKALAEKHPFSITAESKENIAEIRISGVIHKWQNSAEAFKNKIDVFIEEGITDVNLYVNSAGGSVFEANEIVNEISRFKGTINGYGGALVASAASYIALMCDTFELASNGHYMYHKPIGELQGNEDTIKPPLKLLGSLTSQYRKDYAAKTGMTEDQIENKWNKGDVWLNAKEALAQKFITGISKSKAPITQDQKAIFTACGAPRSPRINTKTENKMNFKMIAQSLGLSPDATEEEINAKVLDNQKKAKAAEVLIEANKVKEAADIKAKANNLLNKAVADKKITAEQAENMTGWAESSYDDCEKHIASLQPLEKVTAAITPSKGGGVVAKKFEDMTESEQQELSENDPEAFVKAYTAYTEK